MGLDEDTEQGRIVGVPGLSLPGKSGLGDDGFRDYTPTQRKSEQISLGETDDERSRSRRPTGHGTDRVKDPEWSQRAARERARQALSACARPSERLADRERLTDRTDRRPV